MRPRVKVEWPIPCPFLIILDRYCLPVKVFFLWQNSSPSSDQNELIKTNFHITISDSNLSESLQYAKKTPLIRGIKKEKGRKKAQKNLQH